MVHQDRAKKNYSVDLECFNPIIRQHKVLIDRGAGLEELGQSHLWCETYVSSCLKMLTNNSFLKRIIIRGHIQKKRKVFLLSGGRE